MEFSQSALTSRLHAAGTFTDIAVICQEVAESFGFNYCLFRLWLVTPVRGPMQLILNNFPKALRDIYAEKRFVKVDPVLQHAKDSTVPMLWDLTELPRTRQTNYMLDIAANFGVNSGITVPIHGQSNSMGFLLMARGTSLPASQKERTALTANAMLFTTLVHNAVISVLKHSIQPQQRKTHLTSREKECLILAALGHTGDGIADALALSRRTVMFHLDGARTKLGVRSRREAITRALASGQIMLVDPLRQKQIHTELVDLT